MECGTTPDEKKTETELIAWQKIVPRNQIFEGIHGHSTVRYGNDLWIYGGARHGWALNQLSCFDLDRRVYRVVYPLILERENVILTHTELPYISDHSAVVYKDKMYIFGGRGHASRRDGINVGVKQPIYNDLYQFDFKTESWMKLNCVGDIPPPRKAFGFVQWQNRMYIFCGWNNQNFFNEVYYLDLDKLNWVKVNCRGTIPAPRHDILCILNGNEVYLWGGSSGFDQNRNWIHHSDMYIFDLQTETFTDISKPFRPPAMEAQNSVLYKNYIFMFGGHDGIKYYNQLWRFDCTSHDWKACETVNRPSPRACATMEVVDDSVLLIGGYGPAIEDMEAFMEYYRNHHDPRDDPYLRYNDIYTVSIKELS